MSKPKIVLGLLCAVLVGCVASQMAPFVIPPARAGTSPQKWEYTCVQTIEKAPDKIAAFADKLGQQGWEMAGATAFDYYADWCFKRPLP
jgi:hypothetical protein